MNDITLTEAAELYPLAYSTLAQAAREGRLECRRSGPKTWITTRAAVEEAIANGKLRPRQPSVQGPGWKAGRKRNE